MALGAQRVDDVRRPEAHRLERPPVEPPLRLAIFFETSAPDRRPQQRVLGTPPLDALTCAIEPY